LQLLCSVTVQKQPQTVSKQIDIGFLPVKFHFPKQAEGQILPTKCFIGLTA
jgi:hypothetical protein